MPTDTEPKPELAASCSHCPPIDDRCRCPRGMKHHAIGCHRYPTGHPIREQPAL